MHPSCVFRTSLLYSHPRTGRQPANKIHVIRGFHTYEIRVNGTICSEGTQFCDWWGVVVCQCARYRNIITWELVPDATYQATRYSVGPDEWNLVLPKFRSGFLAGV